MKPLSQIPKLTSVFVLKINNNREAVELFATHGVKAKQIITVVSTTKEGITIEAGQARFIVPQKIADTIFVSEALNDLEQAFAGNQTKQREVILAVLKKTKEHFTLEEFTKKVQRVNPRIGQVTVYRALKTLTEKEVLDMFVMPDGSRKFEIKRGYHDHIICEVCGAIYDFYDAELERLQKVIAERHGVALERHKMQLFGQGCPQCPEL